MPVRYVAAMVPMPAAVPPRPLTDATDRAGYRSAGRFRIIVDTAAYENVAMAKYAVTHISDETYTAGMSSTIPTVPSTTTDLRARPTLHPRWMSVLDNPPPEKLPISAARNGTQTASRLRSIGKPRLTR